MCVIGQPPAPALHLHLLNLSFCLKVLAVKQWEHGTSCQLVGAWHVVGCMGSIKRMSMVTEHVLGRLSRGVVESLAESARTHLFFEWRGWLWVVDSAVHGG